MISAFYKDFHLKGETQAGSLVLGSRPRFSCGFEDELKIFMWVFGSVPSFLMGL